MSQSNGSSRRLRRWQLEEQIAEELRIASLRQQTRGEAPTPQTAPALMAAWRHFRDDLIAKGPTRHGWVVGWDVLRCRLVASWGWRGELQWFRVCTANDGKLLFTADANGPVVASNAPPHSQHRNAGPLQPSRSNS